MNDLRLSLTVLPDRLAVCRLMPAETLPAWAWSGDFVSITRTCDELSIVCVESSVPEGVKAERDWRALKVAGPLDFALVGILAALATALTQAGISLFAVSTFDTDYLLVRDRDLSAAMTALRAAGHHI